MVEAYPYPHAVVDDVLPEDELRALLETWPAPEMFSPEIPGNTAIWLNSSPPPDAWRWFLPSRVEQLARDILASFAPWVISRMGEDVGPVTAHTCVMQATPDFSGHRIHNHHYHSPNWLATALIYLDNSPGGFEGTVIQRHESAGDISAAADLFIHTGMWSELPGFSEHAVIEYRANRMFCFADGPTSFHSSHKPAGGVTGLRRAFRMHLAAPWDVSQQHYGVTEPQYRDLHPTKRMATDPRVAEWAERDVSAMIAPTSIDIESAMAWAEAIDIAVPLAA